MGFELDCKISLDDIARRLCSRAPLVVKLRLHDVPNYKSCQLYLYNPNVQIFHTKDIASLDKKSKILVETLGRNNLENVRRSHMNDGSIHIFCSRAGYHPSIDDVNVFHFHLLINGSNPLINIQAFLYSIYCIFVYGQYYNIIYMFHLMVK